jgi:uncharacterized protein YegP (UPF0339 family)
VDINRRPVPENLAELLSIPEAVRNYFLHGFTPSTREELRWTGSKAREIIERYPSSASDAYRVQYARQRAKSDDPFGADFSCLTATERGKIVEKACRLNGEDCAKAISRIAPYFEHLSEKQIGDIVKKACELDDRGDLVTAFNGILPHFEYLTWGPEGQRQDVVTAICHRGLITVTSEKLGPVFELLTMGQRDAIADDLCKLVSHNPWVAGDAIEEIGPSLFDLTNDYGERILTLACQFTDKGRVPVLAGIAPSFPLLTQDSDQEKGQRARFVRAMCELPRGFSGAESFCEVLEKVHPHLVLMSNDEVGEIVNKACGLSSGEYRSRAISAITSSVALHRMNEGHHENITKVIIDLYRWDFVHFTDQSIASSLQYMSEDECGQAAEAICKLKGRACAKAIKDLGPFLGNLRDGHCEKILTRACALDGENRAEAFNGIGPSFQHLEKYHDMIVTAIDDLQGEDFAKAMKGIGPYLEHLHETQSGKLLTKLCALPKDCEGLAEAIGSVGLSFKRLGNGARGQLLTKACEFDSINMVPAIAGGISKSLDLLTDGERGQIADAIYRLSETGWSGGCARSVIEISPSVKLFTEGQQETIATAICGIDRGENYFAKEDCAKAIESIGPHLRDLSKGPREKITAKACALEGENRIMALSGMSTSIAELRSMSTPPKDFQPNLLARLTGIGHKQSSAA